MDSFTKQKIDLFSVSGTRDLFPEDVLKKNWLLDCWKKASLICNFREYDSSIVENASLWITKESNDDILSEMFSVTDGNDNVKLILRPEMTPTVCRMVLQHLKTDLLPMKWFSVSQCWRNETTTLGRGREFYQWNCDIFGADSYQYEAELLWMIVSFMKMVGLTSKDVVIKISDKQFIQSYLSDKFSGDITGVFNIVDKINKKNLSEIEAMLLAVGMDEFTIVGLLKLVTVKDITILQNVLGETVVSDTNNLLELLQVYDRLD